MCHLRPGPGCSCSSQTRIFRGRDRLAIAGFDLFGFAVADLPGHGRASRRGTRRGWSRSRSSTAPRLSVRPNCTFSAASLKPRVNPDQQPRKPTPGTGVVVAIRDPALIHKRSPLASPAWTPEARAAAVRFAAYVGEAGAGRSASHAGRSVRVDERAHRDRGDHAAPVSRASGRDPSPPRYGRAAAGAFRHGAREMKWTPSSPSSEKPSAAPDETSIRNRGFPQRSY